MLLVMLHSSSCQSDTCSFKPCPSLSCIGYAAPKLTASRDTALAAMAQNGSALSDASPELEVNLEFVLAAVANSGHTLGLSAPQLKANAALPLRPWPKMGGQSAKLTTSLSSLL